MSVSSEEIAAKAEARRKKLLENAQKRLNKVLSRSESTEYLRSPMSLSSQYESTSGSSLECSTTVKENISSEQMSNSTNSRSMPKTHLQNTLDAWAQCSLQSSEESDPLEFPLLESLSRDHTLLQTKLNPTSNVKQTRCQDLKSSKRIILLSHLQYIVLAIVVRLMLYWQMGWMFGEMILVPFLMTESIQISLRFVHTSRLVQVFGYVMALCGVSSQMVERYTKVYTILLHCVEDFSIYFVTFCLIHNYLDEEFELT